MRAAIDAPSAFVVLRPAAQGFSVEPVNPSDGGGWRVVGRQAERAVALSDLTNPDALRRATTAQAPRRRPGAGVPAPAKVNSPGRHVRLRLATTSDQRKTVVVKIGTSSITDDDGVIDAASVQKLCDEVATLRADGNRVVVVTTGAIAAGLPALGMRRADGRDTQTLQAVSAVGQTRLLRVYEDAFAKHGLVTGQVLITPLDFGVRQQYLHARGTIRRLLELGVVPVVNENDAIADDEIRFGDNDRLAALVAHLVVGRRARAPHRRSGLLTADPRLDPSASLIEEIVEIDATLEALAGGAGTSRGSGGMASKVAAAKIAAWSGVRAVIAGADRKGVLTAAVAGEPGVGTVVVPRDRRLPARKLWIAFAIGASGVVTVDDGARTALCEGGRSLLPAGVVNVAGRFAADDAVELTGPDGKVFAKGLVRAGSDVLTSIAGRRTADLPEGVPHEVVHRDDLVVLPPG